MINLKKLLNETFLGGGDLPSSKLIKMKQTLAETMADDSDDSISEGDGLWANIRAKKARGENLHIKTQKLIRTQLKQVIRLIKMNQYPKVQVIWIECKK
tara:strand:+ start:135 stop:431 length:297 start_codon:yes stop_codon:yes gene_type:complete